ncbi:MAG: hypothetical protein APF81_19815 [Desulfosporosinus sp. BRH_c37]|nr:MAG: hypothetical protein APF81_19815 [Desulfosporosinus sp. BRH_c37]
MTFIYHSKLFKQLTAVIGLLVILAIGIPGAFSLFYITPNVVEDRYHKVMINDVDFLADRLDWLLNKSLEDVEYLSKKIQLFNSAMLDEAGKVMDIFVRSSAIFTGGIATDRNGQMQLFDSSPQGIIELKHKFDISDRDYIQYPLAKNQSYLSDVIITHSNPSPVIFVSCAVMEHAQISGVLALSINLWNENTIFHSLVNGFQENKQGNIYVVDGQGRIVFHKDREIVGQTIDPSILAQIANDKKGTSYNIPTEKGTVDIAYLSLQDYLTGLANRRYFEQQFELEMERACRIGHPTSLLMLDIDDFKDINDKFGF